MSGEAAQPHVGIDVRLRDYRVGGIAAHGEMLVEGLAALPEISGAAPALRITAIQHMRGRKAARTVEAERAEQAGRADGAVGAGGSNGSNGSNGSGGSGGSDGSDGSDGTLDSEAGSSRPIDIRFVRTPPHHRFEGSSLPFELAFGPRLDLLHSPDFIVPSAWRGPAVVTVHDLAFLRNPEYLTAESRRYYGQVHRSVERAERVIAVSEHTRRELLALTSVDPERVRVVHNALRPDVANLMDTARDLEFEGRVLEKADIRRPFILFVSTIEPRKDAETLLHAYRRLLDEGRDIGLLLVGSHGWNSESVYATWRDLGLESQARFIGVCDGDTLTALYRAAELLAHPARDEGFGLTPLEALALGTPAVVSDAGALPEVVGEAALRVPPGDPAAWAMAIARVLDDAALAARLRALGPQRAAHFSLERMARGTFEVYLEALAVGGAIGP